MKKIILITTYTTLFIFAATAPLPAQSASSDEALTVAQNWITLIIRHKGHWGGAPNATIENIREFKRGQRGLGYFCRVRPRGFIVLSARRELAPIKAYSDTSGLDPASDRGLADLIKGGMERILDGLDTLLGPAENLRSADVINTLEINYQIAWDELNLPPATYQSNLTSGLVPLDYQEGEILLSSQWSQGDPYNALCPTGDTTCPDCDTGAGFDPPSDPTLVGCTATAIAQIMKYWSWPPVGQGSHSYAWDGDDSCPAGGTSGAGATTLSATFSDLYEWRYLVNEYHWVGGQWEDENGNPLTQNHLDAIAELCYEVGVADEEDYGGCGSGAPLSGMEYALENYFRYGASCSRKNRTDFNAIAWFNLMKEQLNRNRPVAYHVVNHNIVGDGWQEIGATPLRQYHMNYGWTNTGRNTWYTLDALHLGDYNTEYFLQNIYPEPILGASLSGLYNVPAFPHRYFDRDATGSAVVFNAGHYLHFLPGITVSCTGAGGSVVFYGTSADHTRHFTRGNYTRGVRIEKGAIKMNQNGAVVFR